MMSTQIVPSKLCLLFLILVLDDGFMVATNPVATLFWRTTSGSSDSQSRAVKASSTSHPLQHLALSSSSSHLQSSPERLSTTGILRFGRNVRSVADESMKENPVHLMLELMKIGNYPRLEKHKPRKYKPRDSGLETRMPGLVFYMMSRSRNNEKDKVKEPHHSHRFNVPQLPWSRG